MLLDCDSCAVRDLQCGDCVVTVLLGAPPGGAEVDDAERQALAVLADSGLVPRLRLVPLGVPTEGLDTAAADPATARLGGCREVS